MISELEDRCFNYILITDQKSLDVFGSIANDPFEHHINRFFTKCPRNASSEFTDTTPDELAEYSQRVFSNAAAFYHARTFFKMKSIPSL